MAKIWMLRLVVLGDDVAVRVFDNAGCEGSALRFVYLHFLFVLTQHEF